jgi:hypothetical protein
LSGNEILDWPFRLPKRIRFLLKSPAQSPGNIRAEHPGTSAPNITMKQRPIARPSDKAVFHGMESRRADQRSAIRPSIVAKRRQITPATYDIIAVQHPILRTAQ